MNTVLTMAFRLIFWGLAFGQMFAVTDGIEHLTGWSIWLALPLSTFVMMIPGLNIAAGIYGAIAAWGWPWYLAVPVMLGGAALMLAWLSGVMLGGRRYGHA